jgi:hypothetical protein
MSLPRRDPNFTIKDLQEVGQRFLDAGLEYFDACCKAGIDGAVIWLEATDGKLCIFTRGEYRTILLNNIERLGPVTSFGSMVDE